ncbi:hypothetical protein [Trinickia acidisoli]|uniref:hypothetical protein n=1 Tax=Trinickia acidisoli TaxID=2767482 RepID=UPI001F5DAAB0|nr:hypothetical protein [Trinickia acidisoli]
MITSFLNTDSPELPGEEFELHQWLADWHHYALTDGHIHSTYELDDETVERLESYFKLGLTPREGVGVLFGTLH